jgi:hypothetical protein
LHLVSRNFKLLSFGEEAEEDEEEVLEMSKVMMQKYESEYLPRKCKFCIF